MTSDEEAAYRRAEIAAHAARKRLLESTRADLIGLLRDARKETVLILAGAPTEYEQWRATALQADIDRVLAELASQSGKTLAAAATSAWEGGIASIVEPLAAAGLGSSYVQLDTRQLLAMRAFMVDRIADISTVAASTIKRELGLAMIGGQPLQATIAHVQKALDDASNARATTIVRTELGRVWAVAANDRALESSGAGIEMDKVWRRSGKIHSRFTHDLADGQRVPVDKPFTVGTIKMMHPHDPAAPASETINCGCIALYRPRDSKSRLPDKRPFTRDEINANPFKADLEKRR